MSAPPIVPPGADPRNSAGPNPPDLTRYLAEPSAAEQHLARLFGRQAPLVVLDIGACEGEESIRYARAFPRARIFAFEPLPANQELIRVNLARHSLEGRVELVPLALADETGESTFHVSSGRPREEFSGPDWNYGNKSSSLLPPASASAMHGWIEFKESITVRTDTLARFCASRGLSRIDFVHLDVQGAELRVLRGAGAHLARVTALWLEVADRELYRGQALRGEIHRYLRSRGFALVAAAMHGVEGDAFYVNLRHPRAWRHLATHRARRGLAALRFRAGALRASWRGTGP